MRTGNGWKKGLEKFPKHQQTRRRKWSWKARCVFWQEMPEGHIPSWRFRYNAAEEGLTRCYCSRNWGEEIEVNGTRKIKSRGMILLLEEILHHLGCIKPCKQRDKLPINWCRISSISSRIYFEIYFESTFLIEDLFASRHCHSMFKGGAVLAWEAQHPPGRDILQKFWHEMSFWTCTTFGPHKSTPEPPVWSRVKF